MSAEVKVRRIAAIAGVAAAVCIALALTPSSTPDLVVAAFGGPRGVDRVGGVTVRYRSPRGAEAVVELPEVPEELAAQAVDELAGGLAMRVVRETDYAAQIVRAVGDSNAWTDDAWTAAAGTQHHVGYLFARSRAALEQQIDLAAARGWRLPAGSEIGLGRSAAWGQVAGWRTYELAPEVELDGSMVASAARQIDPGTGRPIVVLELTADGARRFCALTRRIAGQKLAMTIGRAVRSAPVIDAAICGGRAVVTPGPGPEAEREVVTLVAVLDHGHAALPPGSVVVSARWQPPADIAPQVWLARLALGIAAALIAAAGCFTALQIARPRWRTPPPPSTGGFPWRRLAVTLLAPAALYGLPGISLPGVNAFEIARLRASALDVLHGGSGPQAFSVIAIGIAPVLGAFILVELAVLAVPRLRWRRHDPRGRAVLGKAVAAVAVVVAAVQGYFVALYLETAGADIDIVDAPGLRFRVTVVVALGAGTLLLVLIAAVVREHGLGNGYGALIASETVIALVGRLDEATRAGPASWLGALALVGTVVATIGVLRWRITGGAREPALRVPSSGIEPLVAVTGATVVVAQLAAFGVAAHIAGVSIAQLAGSLWLQLGILAVFTLACSWLFARPAVIARAAFPANMDPPSRDAWRRATLLALVVLVPPLALATLGGQIPAVLLWFPGGVAGVAVTAAALLDIVDDARARRARLLPAWIAHQVQYLGVIERVLGDAGIACHLHASHLRTLLAFFGPWAPVIVLVPEDRAREATAKLDAALRPASGTVPVAQVQLRQAIRRYAALAPAASRSPAPPSHVGFAFELRGETTDRRLE